ncbi:MAG TPA: ATP-binding protein [Steroidobacteraceae bacterium]|nr:ATP-binding protein [Steroidobacteraceae bacterium]
MTQAERYTEEYRAALQRFMDGAGEAALSNAYEIGRRALAGGLGILDLVSMHEKAVATLLHRKSADDMAGSFLLESLSPFEISLRSVDEANAALRRLNELLEGEVGRIAHALHDQAGSILATATLELDMAVRELLPSGHRRLASVRRLLDETGEQLRHLSHELRPTILDDLGLRPALEFLAQGIEQRTGLKIKVTGQLRTRLPVGAEIALYRIAHEALNNTVRHGGGSPGVTIALEQVGGGPQGAEQVRCVISDDGAGFDADAVLAPGGKRGLGLLGMRERASAVGGTCQIISAPGQGTRVEVVVPLEPIVPVV